MKYFLSTLLLLTMIFSISTKSRAQELGQGNAIFSLGHGFVAPANAAFDLLAQEAINDTTVGLDQLSFRNLGPYYLKGEYMLSDKSGLGINFAFISNSVSFTEDVSGYENKAIRNNLSIMLRYNYYLQTRESFDLYGGLGAGIRTGGWKIEFEDPTMFNVPGVVLVPLAFEATIGFRAYPIDNLAIYGEVGLSKALAQIGIAYRL
jgi:outer membrane protein W